ncbi:MFS transporter [Microbacterium sp. B2969]|uniref:MFS transporter n=1 Tax=Microbacterium alkaliflavum TaxID=3248839 RepID=A0ABW7QDQ2_9MICO
MTVEVQQKTITLDEAPLRSVHILAAGAVLGGAILDGYVLGIVGPMLALANEELQLSPVSQGLIASSALIGVLVGGMFFGNLADRFGRKPVFAVNLASFVVLSLLQLGVTEVWQLLILRIALGLAVGVEYAVGSSMLAEFSRRRGRGVLLGTFEVAWMVGFIAAFVVGNLYQGDNWRLLLATSAIPALITFLFRLRLPESPMWLKAQGRDADADAVVRKHFGPGLTVPPVAIEKDRPRVRDLFSRDTWRPHLYAGVFWFCQVGPFFAIFTFLGPVFRGLGLTDMTTVDVWLNGIQLAGALFGLVLLHWLTRRHFVISTFAIMFGALLLLGLLPGAPFWLVIVLFGVYMFVAPAANNIERVYPAEIFDTRMRATGIGFAAAFSRISAAAAVYLLPSSIASLGTSATLLLLAVFPLVGLVLSVLWAPETKRKHLT